MEAGISDHVWSIEEIVWLLGEWGQYGERHHSGYVHRLQDLRTVEFQDDEARKSGVGGS